MPENSKVFIETENMKINYKKTKLMLFNPSKTKDFLPRFVLNNHELDLVEETKLLGLVIRSDISWTFNTLFMVKRASGASEFSRTLVQRQRTF